MSNGTQFYKFNSQEELKAYFGSDLTRIINLVLEEGIVCEGQCEKLNSYIIEELGSSLLIMLLYAETGVNVIPDYSKETRIYFLYDYEKISRDEALKKCAKWAEVYLK